MIIEPPALPGPIADERDETIDRVESRWDTLARNMMRTVWYVSHYERGRVVWLHYSWLHWHCGERMRIARCDTQPEEASFAWKTEYVKGAACGVCGYVRKLL